MHESTIYIFWIGTEFCKIHLFVASWCHLFAVLTDESQKFTVSLELNIHVSAGVVCALRANGQTFALVIMGKWQVRRWIMQGLGWH